MLHWFTYSTLPVLIGLAVTLAAIFLPPRYERGVGESVPTRILQDRAIADPQAAWLRAQGLPTLLQSNIEPGSTWLLANLSEAKHSAAQAGVLVIPSGGADDMSCWFLQSTAGGLLTSEAAGQLMPVNALTGGLLGTRISWPRDTSAEQLLCHMNVQLPTLLSVQSWSRDAFFGASMSASQTLGLLEGGYIAMAIVLLVYALTVREALLILVACWLIATMRLGAWALGWDHQILGHAIHASWLLWVRQFTLVAFYGLTCGAFARMYHSSIDTRTRKRVLDIGHISAGVLLIALIALPPVPQGIVLFFATWLLVALLAVILTYAFSHYDTTVQLTHTVGVACALLLLLAGAILATLHREALLANPVATTLGLLLVGLLVTLAASERGRSMRLIKLRHRSELVARDPLAPRVMFTLGATGHFEHMNHKGRALFNLPPETDVHSLTWTDFFDEPDWPAVALATEEGRDTEILQTRNMTTPEPRSFLLRAALVGSRIEGSLQDVSARSESLRRLRTLADQDPITGSLNREGIQAAIEEAIGARRSSGEPCAVGFLNLDHMEHFNDLFGHSAADALLRMVAERMRYSLTEQQKVGRVGRDDFIVLFPGLHASEAGKVGADLIESLNSAALTVGERAFQLKSAIGIVEIDDHMESRDVIASATRACRDARKNHQEVVVYEEGAHELTDHFDELHLLERLYQGETTNDIQLQMQPIMSLRAPLKTLQFEALLRIKSDDRALSTQRLIDTAEDNGMITAIDKWVFKVVLDWIGEHHQSLNHVHCVNLNLSGVSLNDDRFVDTLVELLNRQPQFTRRLCVEITEGVALQDMERTRQFMRRLQRMGARVALDDFGAGYTSFSYLRALPADLIKIDGTLIRDLAGNTANIAIVRGIVDLTHNLNMGCIAEWVEDLETLQLLAGLGVDYVQGHIISKPRPPGDILRHDNILPLIEDPAVRSYVRDLGQRTPG